LLTLTVSLWKRDLAAARVHQVPRQKRDRAGKPVNLSHDQRTVLMDLRVLAGFVPAGTDPAHPGL
jgi:hypothetical protein